MSEEKNCPIHPMKVYVNRKDKTYKKLIKELDKEKSLLGSDNDRDGKFYLIVDVKSSPLIQSFLEESA